MRERFLFVDLMKPGATNIKERRESAPSQQLPASEIYTRVAVNMGQSAQI